MLTHIPSLAILDFTYFCGLDLHFLYIMCRLTTCYLSLWYVVMSLRLPPPFPLVQLASLDGESLQLTPVKQLLVMGQTSKTTALETVQEN